MTNTWDSGSFSNPRGPFSGIVVIVPDDAAGVPYPGNRMAVHGDSFIVLGAIQNRAAAPATVVVETTDGTVATLVMAAGELLYLKIKRVLATGTTIDAGTLIGYY